MIRKYNSLKETIDATTAFVLDTREADIKRTNPEEILNLFIAANRFGREAIAACYRKLYGPEYDTSNRSDYVIKPVYKKCRGYCYPNNLIVINWSSFITSSYTNMLELIAHEIAHDVCLEHREKFWHAYYRNCQGLGLIASDIAYEDGMVVNKSGMRKYGYGRIIGFKRSYLNFAISPITLERRINALVKHNVFTRDWDEYIIKPEFMPLALDICKQYQVMLGYRFKLFKLKCGNADFTTINESWLNNHSDDIFDPSILKCITRDTPCFKDAKNLK